MGLPHLEPVGMLEFLDGTPRSDTQKAVGIHAVAHRSAVKVKRDRSETLTRATLLCDLTDSGANRLQAAESGVTAGDQASALICGRYRPCASMYASTPRGTM